MKSDKEYDKKVLRIMVTDYCQHTHQQNGLCGECMELISYATTRIDKCPLGDKKVTCQVCSTHCYASTKREEIKAVMHFAGKRLMFSHPIMALRHLSKMLFYRDKN